MIRFLVNTAVYMAAAAIGLLIASLVLDNMSIDGLAFFVVALIFGLVQAILTPLFDSIASKNAPVLSGGVGLFSALIALIITDLLSDGLSISGWQTWLGAALIVWLTSMIAAFILKITVAKKVIKEVRD